VRSFGGYCPIISVPFLLPGVGAKVGPVFTPCFFEVAARRELPSVMSFLSVAVISHASCALERPFVYLSDSLFPVHRLDLFYGFRGRESIPEVLHREPAITTGSFCPRLPPTEPVTFWTVRSPPAPAL